MTINNTDFTKLTGGMQSQIQQLRDKGYITISTVAYILKCSDNHARTQVPEPDVKVKFGNKAIGMWKRETIEKLKVV